MLALFRFNLLAARVHFVFVMPANGLEKYQIPSVVRFFLFWKIEGLELTMGVNEALIVYSQIDPMMITKIRIHPTTIFHRFFMAHENREPQISCLA